MEWPQRFHKKKESGNIYIYMNNCKSAKVYSLTSKSSVAANWQSRTNIPDVRKASHTLSHRNLDAKSKEGAQQCCKAAPKAVRSNKLKAQILAALEWSADRAWSDFYALSPHRSHFNEARCAVVLLSGHTEMTLALLPAYWLKQEAPPPIPKRLTGLSSTVDKRSREFNS